MNLKFKRGQKVKLLLAPDLEYVEYYSEEKIPITKGMTGKINIILPNGQYHIEIHDKKGNIIAYAPLSEDYLELIE